MIGFDASLCWENSSPVAAGPEVDCAWGNANHMNSCHTCHVCRIQRTRAFADSGGGVWNQHVTAVNSRVNSLGVWCMPVPRTV